MTTKIAIMTALALLLVMSALVVTNTCSRPPAPATSPGFKPAASLPAATKISKVVIPVKKIVALEKKAAVKKLKLKAPLATDDNQQIIATATLPPHEGKTSAAAVMDTSTGVSQIIARQEPQSLFAFENKKEIGVRYGLTTGHGLEGALYGRWDFLRIGKAHLGAYGEVNTQGDAKAMLSAAYRW